MPKHRAHGLFSVWMITIGLCMTHTVWAADSTQTSEASTPAKKTKKSKAPKPPADKGYGENRAERDKRLLRECRGKPNSGACEGYTQ